jgi:prefoldin subunit 5
MVDGGRAVEYDKERFEEIKYIFSNIISSVNKNKALFFLGAGFSMNFKIVSWEEFLVSVIDEVLKDISINTTKWINERKQENIEENLMSIKNAISNGTINMEFALEQIYRTIGISTTDFNHENEYAQDIIRGIYKEHFFVDRTKVNELNVDEKKLFDIADIFKKVITTNYDNLLPFVWSEYWNVSEMPNSFIDIKNFKYTDEDKFCIQFHGGVLNENFNNKNIWKVNEEGNGIQFPIIDSFSSFQIGYSLDESKIREFLDNIFSEILADDGRLIFFGYSFRDQFVSKEIMDIISKRKFMDSDERQIYIFLDDLDNFILKHIELMAPHDDGDILMPLSQQPGVEYVNYSDLILYKREYSSYSSEISKLEKKLKLLNEAVNEFKEMNEVSKKVLTAYILEHKEFKNIKTMLYKNLMNDFLDCYNAQSKHLKWNWNYSMKDIPDTFAKQFHRTYLYKCADYKVNRIYRKYLLNQEIDDFPIYCYSLIYLFNLKIGENRDIFRKFFKFYNKLSVKIGNPTKLPEFQIRIFGDTEESSKIDELLNELEIDKETLKEW